MNDFIPKLDILNARTIRFECPEGAAVDYLTNDDSKIISVNYSGNKANISVGAKFVFDIEGHVTNYDIKEIEVEASGRVFMLNTHTITKATSFITPILTTDKDLIGYEESFINCYISRDRDGELKLVLLQRNIMDNTFKKVLQNLENLKGFRYSTVVDRFYTQFVYDIPDKFKNDVELFINGKYSKISEVLKSRIITFHKLSKSSMLYKVLYRDITLKKFIEMDLNEDIPDNLDLYSIPDPDVEIIELYE